MVFVDSICETWDKEFKYQVDYGWRPKRRFCGQKCAWSIRMQPWQERFWQKVQKIKDACWKWNGTKFDTGYGAFWRNGKQCHVVRLMWEITNGDIKQGLFVCHHCDNPNCVNPDHLFLGTQKDNMHDCIAKGRHTCQKQRTAKGQFMGAQH